MWQKHTSIDNFDPIIKSLNCMAKNKITSDQEENLDEILDKIIKSKKAESDALMKIYDSFEKENKKDNSKQKK